MPGREDGARRIAAACRRPAGRSARPRGARSRAPGRESAPARARGARSGRAAADNACRRARPCRCAPRRPRRSRARSRRRSPHRRPARRAARASASAASAAEPTSVTSQPWPKLRISAWVYSRVTVASVPSTETQLGLRGRAGRLDRRHRADERHREARPQRRQHEGRGGVAGDHDEVGLMRRDEVGHHGDDARDELALRPAAVGKQRVVGRIDEARVGPRARDLAIDRQSAEAGIEHQDGRGTHGAGHDRGADQNGTQRCAVAGLRSKARRGDQRQPASRALPRPRGRLMCRHGEVPVGPDCGQEG